MKQFATRWLSVALVSIMVSFSALAADLNQALEPVDRFQGGLLKIMKTGPELGFDGRREQIRELLNDVFDIPYMAQVLIGDHAQSMPADQRQALEDVIFLYAISALASAFDDYDGQQFQTGAANSLRSGKVRVRSEFIDDDGDRATLNFLVRSTTPDWRIVDLYFDGISGIRIYRAEFRSVLQTRSPEALIDELNKRVKKIEVEANAT